MTIVITKYSDGAVVRDISKAGSFQKSIMKLPDGTIETHLADGTFL